MPPSARIRRPPSGFGRAPGNARRILPEPRTITNGRGTSSVRLRDFRGQYLGGGYGVSWTGIEASGEYLQDLADNITGGATAAVIDQLAQQAEDRMKVQAPWEDRTGEARQGLQAVTDHNDKGEHRIHLGHTAPHGYFLETMQGGRFQIIQPTIRWLGEILGPAVEREIKARK